MVSKTLKYVSVLAAFYITSASAIEIGPKLGTGVVAAAPTEMQSPDKLQPSTSPSVLTDSTVHEDKKDINLSTANLTAGGDNGLNESADNPYANKSTDEKIKDLKDFYKQYNDDMKKFDNKQKENEVEAEKNKNELELSKEKNAVEYQRSLWELEKDKKLTDRDKKTFSGQMDIEDIKDQIQVAKLKNDLKKIEVEEKNSKIEESKKRLETFPYRFVNTMVINGKRIAIAKIVKEDELQAADKTKVNGEYLKFYENEYMFGYKIKEIKDTYIVLINDDIQYCLNQSKIEYCNN
jgi:hypothetical protein